MKIKSFLFPCLLVAATSLVAQKYELKSPDGKLSVAIDVGKTTTYTVSHDGVVVIAPSTISMSLDGVGTLGDNVKVASAKRTSVKESIPSPIYKKSTVEANFNQLDLRCKGDYSIVWRAYNEGVAYRFETRLRKDIIVLNEEANFVFDNDYTGYLTHTNSDKKKIEDQYWNSFERPYIVEKLTKQDPDHLVLTPALVAVGEGRKVCITEVNLIDYPGMYLLTSSSSPTLKGNFAPYPKKLAVSTGHNNLECPVTEREAYIAKSKGTRTFPWRAIAVSGKDSELLNSDLVYMLAEPCQLSDVSWIKPGKVAWEWWSDWNISGVDFETGINNATYKHYIDFAAKHKIEYLILDEGWAVNKKADLFQVVPEIDLEELIAYGKQKNVDIILWAGYWAFHRDMEKVVKHYSEMGVKGFKIDFLDRDDQDMVNFTVDAAKLCAEYNMLIDYHGVFKPTGLNRTYPNVVNYEGINAMEQLKWDDKFDIVTFDVIFPYIRMLAGPVDYTQGAMRNATRENFKAIYSEPMSLGTRCHQLATYIVFESPLNMLCDSPSNYDREPESTSFIAQIPTVWDETRVINGELGEQIVMARRKGDVWYVGGLNNWTSRTLSCDLSFLSDGEYSAEVFVDGVNAHRVASDYKRTVTITNKAQTLNIKMAPGGGYAAILKKK